MLIREMLIIMLTVKVQLRVCILQNKKSSLHAVLLG